MNEDHAKLLLELFKEVSKTVVDFAIANLDKINFGQRDVSTKIFLRFILRRLQLELLKKDFSLKQLVEKLKV